MSFFEFRISINPSRITGWSSATTTVTGDPPDTPRSARSRSTDKTPGASGRQGFGYILLGLSVATNLSRLTGVHSQITDVTEIERLELRFRRRSRVSSVSRRQR